MLRRGDVPDDALGALLRYQGAAVPVKHGEEREVAVARHDGLHHMRVLQTRAQRTVSCHAQWWYGARATARMPRQHASATARRHMQRHNLHVDAPALHLRHRRRELRLALSKHLGVLFRRRLVEKGAHGWRGAEQHSTRTRSNRFGAG